MQGTSPTASVIILYASLWSHSRSIHICFNAASAKRECLGNETGLMQVVVLPPYADIYRKEVALKISQVIGKWLLLAHLTCLQMEVYIQTSI